MSIFKKPSSPGVEGLGLIMCIYQLFLYNDDERNGCMLSDSSQAKILIQYSVAALFLHTMCLPVLFSV